MSLLATRDLGLTLGLPLFENLDLTLNKGDRVGLIAANGRGKSSLLAALVGDMEPTAGEITRARGLMVGHLAQYVPEHVARLTAYDAVLDALSEDAAENESWRADIILEDLKVPSEFWQKPMSELSGGWQRLILLARAAVIEPDLILMDEPTNHLDLARIALLEQWIAGLPRDLPMLIASHDRAFLDTVTNRTLFLRPDGGRMFPVPFSHARLELEKADEADARRHENDLNKANQLRRQAAKLKNIGINSGSDLLVNKTKQLAERAAKLEAAAKPAHQERSAGDIKLVNAGTHAKALVTFEDAQIATPDGRALFRTGKVWINRGDRIVVMGRNGTGKTQLMNRLAAAIGGEDPQVKATPSVVLGHSDQGLTQLDRYDSPMEAVTLSFDIGDQRARGVLAGAGMSVDVQNGPISALSGGQRARLAMLILRLVRPNFYLLDEPTNHLDIEGQEALEEELLAHGATCLFVSHDRSFVRAVANRFWEVDRGVIREVDSPEAFFATQTDQR